MTNLAKIKKRFFTVITVLAIIDLLFIVYLVWPGYSNASRRAREESLKQQERSLAREVAPLKDIDHKLIQARADIATLDRERIPDRWSVISSQLDKLTQEAGVVPQSIQFKTVTQSEDKNALPGVQPIGIETSVTGEYGKVARFVNSLEQDKLLFIIQEITLSGREAGMVTLQIKFETFLKENPAVVPQS
ncbi:MAG TPA: hypothetical protein VFY05_10415 [Candidatus Angelobacter sp.]|nr:hypothetical protein [Candidatus Angelobacter sp.]